VGRLLVNAMRCQWAKSSGWRCRQQPVLPTPLRASCGSFHFCMAHRTGWSEPWYSPKRSTADRAGPHEPDRSPGPRDRPPPVRHLRWSHAATAVTRGVEHGSSFDERVESQRGDRSEALAARRRGRYPKQVRRVTPAQLGLNAAF
jgi:hypothetical protein